MKSEEQLHHLLEYAAKIAGNTLFLSDVNGKFPQIDGGEVLIALLAAVSNMSKTEVERILSVRAVKHYKEALKRRLLADAQTPAD